MKGLFEITNYAVGIVSSKCTTSSETEGKVKESPKIYGKYMKQFNKLNFST